MHHTDGLCDHANNLCSQIPRESKATLHQAIKDKLADMKCDCDHGPDGFCENFGCNSLDELAAVALEHSCPSSCPIEAICEGAHNHLIQLEAENGTIVAQLAGAQGVLIMVKLHFAKNPPADVYGQHIAGLVSHTLAAQPWEAVKDREREVAVIEAAQSVRDARGSLYAARSRGDRIGPFRVALLDAESKLCEAVEEFDREKGGIAQQEAGT